MADEMPDPARYAGLSRAVLEYSAAFQHLIGRLKTGALTDADWAPFERIVDPAAFERRGVFLTAQAEVIGWSKYKEYISMYGAATEWEGTLRHITETGRRVILELEERNTRDGETDISNTVTVYEFDDAGRLVHLDVYVMPLGQRPASARLGD